MYLPAPIAWLELFGQSIYSATDETVDIEISPTINPLVYKLRLDLSKLSGRSRLLVWNILQIFASVNDCVIPLNSLEDSRESWVLELVTKRRLGPKRNTHPLE